MTSGRRSTKRTGTKGGSSYKTVSEYLRTGPEDLQDLHRHSMRSSLRSVTTSLKTTQFYLAYRRLKNFACVQVHPK